MSNRMLNVERIPDHSLSGEKMSSTFNSAVEGGILNGVKVIGMKDSTVGPQYIYIQSLVPLEGKKITFARYLTANKSVYVKKTEAGERERIMKKTRKWTLVPPISTDSTSKGWGVSIQNNTISLQLYLEKQPSSEYPYYLYSFNRKKVDAILKVDDLIGWDSEKTRPGFFVSEYDLDALTFRWRWGRARKVIDSDYRGRVQFKAGFYIDGVIIPFTMQASAGRDHNGDAHLYTCIV